ncbi:uncharacterized protein VTP21DRAFT_2612 [Calcarisporiella thermophila]|uniref:uncharacterized protein n=1 Tax=Calcarisporiella thermophila TaxID=911321 RepID=UPI003743256C
MADSTLRIAPAPSLSTTSHSTPSTSQHGSHDTLRHGIRTVVTEVLPKHPLEQQLANWEETQQSLKLEMHRRVYGIHAPVRLLMEKNIVAQMQRLPGLPSSGVGLDILAGKDESLEFEDVLGDPEHSTDIIDIHAAMEHRLGLRV